LRGGKVVRLRSFVFRKRSDMRVLAQNKEALL
jgi:hypothetical protein